MKFSERLKQLRKESNSTQLTVAKAANISDRAYRNLESGVSEPNLNTIILLAKFFNVSLDYIVGITDDPASKINQ
jgi:transcriptional regulator with XRE-family HTH domain